MAVFVNSFPIGIGLALLSLGAVAAALRWQVAFHATAAAALASLLLVAFVYRPHANDGKAGAPGSGQRISRRETALVCIAGAIWGLYNGAFAVMVGFAPNVLVAAGLTAGAASSLVGLTTWLLVASVQAGGIMAQRWGHPNALMLIGIGSWGIGMLLLPTVDPLILVAIGVLQGLPVGVIMSLPAEVLRPESRAVGMGLFYTWLYVGLAGLPPAAGWVQDLTGHPAAPIYFAGVLVLSIGLLFAAIRGLQARAPRPAPLSP
jgi:cyanate permease